MSGLEHLLLDAAALTLVAILVSVLAALAATTMVLRRARRRWRRWRRPPVVQLPGSATAAHVRSALRSGMAPGLANAALTASTTLASPRWWATQQARRRMWRAVGAAGHAVAVARRSGAPIGDLRTLAHQLEAAARSADALARANAGRPASIGPALAQVRRVDDAATTLHRAAVEALEAIAAAEVDPLMSAVRLEGTALAAGTQAAKRLRHTAT